MLTVYNLEESEKWDRTVKTFSDYDVYYLSGYVKAFQLHGDGQPLLFYYENEKIRGINVVMKRDISKDKHFAGKLPENTYFDLSTPYGYGGWLIEGDEDTSEIFEEYEDWCVKNNIISEFVRFHPMLKNHYFSEKNYSVTELGETVAIDLFSKEMIWNNVTSKNRNMIRKAIKNGVNIYYGNYPEIYKIFRLVYNDTMDRDNADEYYYFSDEFYISILNDLPENAQIFYAQLSDGTVVAASIMLAANKKMNYHLSGSLSEYASFAATNLLLYKAACWGCENGYKTLYLGGGVGSEEDSLLKFKKSFYKGETNKFYIGKKIFDNKKYEMLCKMRNDIENNSFFPKYRS